MCIENGSTSKEIIRMETRENMCSEKTVREFPPTSLAQSETVLIQLHSISLITSLAFDVEALASADPNSPAHAHINLNLHQPDAFFPYNEGFIYSFCLISTEQGLEELKKLLLLLLGCAVQVKC